MITHVIMNLVTYFNNYEDTNRYTFFSQLINMKQKGLVGGAH